MSTETCTATLPEPWALKWEVARPEPYPWTLDGEGYLWTKTGVRAARVAGGVIYLWDKFAKCECPLTMSDIARMADESFSLGAQG